MKKSFFSLAFLLLFIVSFNNVYPQSLSSLIKLKISEETEEGHDQKEDLSFSILDEKEKKSELNKADKGEIVKSESKSIQPSSSRISIGIGKALFDKYIK